MLKVVKYDIRSAALFPAFIMIVLTAFFFWGLRAINVELSTTYSMVHAAFLGMLPGLNMLCYLMSLVIVIGVLGWKSSKDIELYEMAGVSPIRVGLIRMLLVFIIMTTVALYITLLETLTVTYSINKSGHDIVRYFIFSIYGQGISSILLPVFMGIFATVIYSTSLLFATVTRRCEREIFKVLILSAVIAFFIWSQLVVAYRIDFIMSILNLNKYGAYGPIIPLSINYDAINIIMLNYLNIGLVLYHGLYVLTMFIIYSLRRKLA